MLVLGETASSADGSALWELRRTNSKALLPLEEYTVVVGQCSSTPARQLTCIGGHVKPSPTRTLLVLPVPVRSSASIAPAIQILEVGDTAVHFLQDVKACFPSLIRKSPLAYQSDSGESDSDEGDEDAERANRQRCGASKNTGNSAAPPSPAIDPVTEAFLGLTRVTVLPSVDLLSHAYAIAAASEVLAAILRDLASTSSVRSSIQLLCVEFPAHRSSMPEKSLNFGVVFTHDRDMSATRYLQVPVLREPRGFFEKTSNFPRQADAMDEDEYIFNDATVFSFNTKRESTEFGGGKTSEETVKNIRMRHASGTFCTLVYPSMTWAQVVSKYSVVLPQAGALRGDLRSRRIMGMVPNRQVEILLEQ